MVLQIAAHAFGRLNYRNAKIAQPFCRANAGTLQHLDGTDRAGAKNDLAFGAGLDHFTATPETNAHGALAFQQQLVHLDIGFQPQIGPPQHRLAEIRAPPTSAARASG